MKLVLRIVFIWVVVILNIAEGHPWLQGRWNRPIENIGKHWERIEDKLDFEDFLSDCDFETGTEMLGWTDLDKCANMVKKQYIPLEFDARRKWPQCRSLWEIRDQGQCDSWASVAASVLTDRWCIARRNEPQLQFSAHDLIACGVNATGWDTSEDVNGCKGGNIFKAWKYIEEHSLVTGGSYGSGDGCIPYKIAPCNHTSNEFDNSKMPACGNTIVETPTCSQECEPKSFYGVSYNEDKDKLNFTKSACTIEKNQVEEIQTEIMMNGPVAASMLLCDDFMTHKTTVYRRSSTKCHKYHSVKLLGWGYETNVEYNTTTNYWIAANSWNYYWGDHGFFKIIRGHPSLGAQIEQQVSAIFPGVKAF